MNDPERTGAYQPGVNDEPAVDAAHNAQPQHIGRYRIEKILGQGGFGLVYLAHDDRLQRLVAIKVPHRKLVDRQGAAEAYLTEARTVANLDHPNIVPVHDVGSTEDCPCFVVSKYIDGNDLARRLKHARLSIHETVELVATVAEALHHAHKQGLVHRDIKPGNILLDKGGKPFVADFGLALREQDVGKGAGYAGTPAYMSPEQARGEGHRVDGRSDIFSLGVVFYELLTGRRPFKGDTSEELLEQVTHFEPRPPRQYDDGIPRELERICLKALAKRASERYTTAKDLADDLRHFLAEPPIHPPSVSVGKSEGFPSATPVVPPPSTSVASRLSGTSSSAATTPTSDSQQLKIVPKGLRSFDAHDADFFLELLPGPRDREGLPDSIRFWKTRLEETDPDNTFAVGLLYGPSGCGKSSLVKAGLLPRLSEHVLTVYIEATANETETRLLNGLRKRCPALPVNLHLKEALAALRRGQGVPTGKKVLIVLDQFEQWLHAKREEANTELVQALRQCDGGRVQCIVMVRDDFWMAATRFMDELEVNLLKGQNMEAADLFDPPHARKVLAAFGRAFAVLPDSSGGVTKDQKQFLEQAVAELSQEGKIICVRLALFAEMMKGRPWTLATLKAVGGIEGVGVTFLEETFSSHAASPKLRLHQKAARAVLRALLPESGTDITGHMRSDAELLAASGYASRPKDFDDLIRILDSETRLITPTDPEGWEAESDSTPQAQPGQKYFQLTHDYLVHSLRDWLTRKQKETRRGRAELRLAERAALWTAKPENRHLPAWWEWTNIRLLTRRRDWTPPQQQMMRKATRYFLRYFLVRSFVVAASLVLAGWGLFEALMPLSASGMVAALKSADTTEVRMFLIAIHSQRRWTMPLVKQMYEESEPHSKVRLHASLALLSVDPAQVDYLFASLLQARPQEAFVIRDVLVDHKQELTERLWAVIARPETEGESQRLRAACALALYDPDSPRWDNAGGAVVEELVAENPFHLGLWLEGFRPVKGRLLAPLAAVFRDRREGRAGERTLATNILADYAADQPTLLADLLLDADAKQFALLYPKFKDHGDRGLTLLLDEVDRQLPPDAEQNAKEKLAKRQANAAVALLKMDRADKVWPLFKHSPDPRVRSYLIHRLGPMGADARTIVERLDEEPDITIRRALVLSLGEFGEKEFPPGERALVVEKLREVYRTAADPGLHGAAEWLLRHWKQDEWLKQIDAEWAKDKQQRERRLERIGQELSKEKDAAKPQWYVNGQGQTLVVIPGPVEFQMGSPATEAGRFANETLHLQRIGRTFAMAAKPVTVEQFRRFRKGHVYRPQWAPTQDCPVHWTTWYDATAYCNWLSACEGIGQDQWCYEPNAQGHYAQGMKLKANYLSLSGYRLPTEAEWEYACRAGAVTSRHYGESEELLGKYGWYFGNAGGRSWPVGSLKPNDFGLFDMHGNHWCWCQERYMGYAQSQGGKLIEDFEDAILNVHIEVSRVMRGSSFNPLAVGVRSAFRDGDKPSVTNSNLGFRPARTFP